MYFFPFLHNDVYVLKPIILGLNSKKKKKIIIIIIIKKIKKFQSITNVYWVQLLCVGDDGLNMQTLMLSQSIQLNKLIITCFFILQTSKIPPEFAMKSKLKERVFIKKS